MLILSLIEFTLKAFSMRERKTNFRPGQKNHADRHRHTKGYLNRT